MEWFIHNHDSIIKQWTLKALTVEPKASHTQHAPPRPQHSQRHWTFLTPRDSWLLKVLLFFFFFLNLIPHPSQFFPCSFFFNPLNIFWYKNKPTYDESTMFVNCFSPFSCYCPDTSPPTQPHPILSHRSSGLYWLEDEHDTGTHILSLPVHGLFMDTWKKKKEKSQSDGVMVVVGVRGGSTKK